MRNASSWLLVLVSLLALSAAGCSNVETGAAEGKPGAADDDDDDDDGGGPGATPTPGQPGIPPTEIGGFAAFGRFVDVNSNDFVGMLNLFPVPAPLPPTFEEIWYGSPDMPMDTCKRVYPSSLGVSSNILPPDPGEVSLEGPAGSIVLTSIMGASYLSVWNDVNKFVPISNYTFKATGNTVQAFAHPLFSPGEITSLTPNPVGPNPYALPRSQPFTLNWSSVPDGKPIYLYLTQKDFPDATEFIWMCKMTDDGSFTVPVEVLSEFGATVQPFVTEEWRDKLELRRANYSSFHPQGAVGPIIVAFESGWYANVEFQ